MAKKSVEIEKLLQWAYVDELSKRVTSSAEGIWDHIEQQGHNGGINPDPGHGAAQRYSHFGLPHPDAEKIEIAVGNLQPLVIDWNASREALMGDLLGLLNARDVLMIRTLRTAALVTSHAIRKTRPDWREDTPQPHRVRAEAGRDRPKIVGECKGKDRYTIGSYCPLQWLPSPISIAQTRADYAAWHSGLVTLVETIELEDHKALLPTAPARPWAGDREPPRKIFSIGRQRQESPLPLRPERPVALRMPRKKKTEETAA